MLCLPEDCLSLVVEQAGLVEILSLRLVCTALCGVVEEHATNSFKLVQEQLSRLESQIRLKRSDENAALDDLLRARDELKRARTDAERLETLFFVEMCAKSANTATFEVAEAWCETSSVILQCARRLGFSVRVREALTAATMNL